MCAENYAWGNAGNDTCPENAARIDSEEACKRAAAVMGKDWGASNNATDRSSGCYVDKRGGSPVFFNAHPVGSGHADARPLCAVGTAASQSHTTCHAPCTSRLPPGTMVRYSLQYKQYLPAA